MQNIAIKNRFTTSMENKYGVSHALQSPQNLAKLKQTCMERFGVDNAMKASCIQGKAQQTCMEHFGVLHPAQCEKVKHKMQQTCMERFGVDNVFKDPDIRERRDEIMLQKYGATTTLASPILRPRMNETMLHKYGSIYPLQNPEIMNRMHESCRNRYGIEHPSSLRMLDPTKYSIWQEFQIAPEKFILDRWGTSKPNVHRISIEVGVSDSGVWGVIHEHRLEHLVSYCKSTMEEDVASWIHSMNPQLYIVRNSKSYISPLELDLYLPDYKLAIECNPTDTHNSSYHPFPPYEPVPYNYHKIKTDRCKERGIFLFHIFGYEWEHKRYQIQSMLANLLFLNDTKVYARDCKVVELGVDSFHHFLDKYHRQGYTNCSTRLGLVCKSSNQLVSVMGFGARRPSLGKLKHEHDGDVELIRFCSRSYCNVVGAASKLLAYFIKHHKDVRRIVSYSDRAHTCGNLYSSLGFQLAGTTSPSYVWVSDKDNTWYTRSKTQKRNISKLFGEEIDFSKTEKQIMEAHGYVQVFDSGVDRWELDIH